MPFWGCIAWLVQSYETTHECMTPGLKRMNKHRFELIRLVGKYRQFYERSRDQDQSDKFILI